MVDYLHDNELDDDLKLLLDTQDKIYLNEEHIPENLRNLMPLVEKWGTLDKFLMYRIMEKVEIIILINFVEKLAPYLEEIQNWLYHPSNDYSDIGQEYSAFTNLVLGFMRAKEILKSK